jgi:hypothetical protein
MRLPVGDHPGWYAKERPPIRRPAGDQHLRLTFTCPPRHGQVVAVNADDHPTRVRVVCDEATSREDGP